MTAQRIAQLEAEVSRLRARERLHQETDSALEAALQQHLCLEVALQRVMPLICQHTGAQTVSLRTFNEDLQLQTYTYPPSAPTITDFEGIYAELSRGQPDQRADQLTTVLGYPFDVAGENFGGAAILIPQTLDQAARHQAAALLKTWCENLDNHLASIAHARRKHQVTCAISDGLKEPVLDRGIHRAIEVLKTAINFDDLLLLYHHETELTGPILDYKIFKDKQLVFDSGPRKDPEVDAFMRAHAAQIIQGDTREVTARFKIPRFQEEVLINGVKHEQVVGRLLLANAQGEFCSFDRDILDRFSDFLRQRIVDFNRERRYLSHSFPPDIVYRMLSYEDYQQRFLDPQEHNVAIMFCDIAGFTRISEQILKTPALIGKLIDTWTSKAVEFIWETGGVFDKMVGDCIIGLWGPPFFDLDPETACRQATEAAYRIRDFTRSLAHAGSIPELAQLTTPLTVTTGLNFCPLFVGLFGPNDDFTGFSSGMNNTARLQGIAEPDEILCMDSFVRTLNEMDCFGERRIANAKNVARPLAFYPLRRAPRSIPGSS